MTLRLILMRHAKSSWENPTSGDHERPLAPRGQRSAKALGGWMRDKGWLPDQILCSSARRTRETLDGLGLDVSAEYLDDLYHASATQMLRMLGQASGKNLLMIGHNPGISDFADQIVDDPPEHPKFDTFPTGATLVVDFQTDDWSAAGWRGGLVRDFVVPRDLTGA